MLMNLIGQLNAISMMNNAQMIGMQARQSQLGLLRMQEPLSYDKVDFSTMHKLHNKDKQLSFAGIKSNFTAKAMEVWYDSLKKQQNKKIEDQYSIFGK